jgi:hypothetical protein
MTAGLTVDSPRGRPGNARRVLESLTHRGFDAATPGWAAATGYVLLFAGAGLIVATSAIHLHLWLAGYRHVPKLDVLFLAQAITGFLLGPAIAAGRHVGLLLGGAAYMASSAGGLVLSATVGFVGIHDGLDVPWATPSLVVELVGFILLSAAAGIALRPVIRKS